ncbi:peptidoglycan-binding protein [Rhodobacterales bacterium HKCCE2091]|nr:peptidoglycan-binding protein [Rhodobacterales bacterium HKCCE2091]
MSILRRGLKGAPVKRLQERLGIAADGDFGPGTEAAVKKFQAEAGLAADGIAGPDTFTALGMPELVLLRRGSRGAAVKKLQEALGIGADGIFGRGTEAAVKSFQEANGLDADGLAGPETLAKIDAFEEVTEETVAKAEVQPDEEAFESEPLPEIDGGEVVAGAEPAVEVPEKRSVWGKVKGWFS